MDAANMGSYLLAMIIGMLVSGVVVVFFGGLILMAMIRLIVSFSPPYLRCCLATLASLIGILAVYLALTFVGVSVSGFSGQLDTPDSYGAIANVMIVVMGMSLVSGFVINVAVLNWLILRPDGSRLGVGPASLITLAQLVLAIIVMMGLGFALALMIGVMPPL